MGVKVLVPFAQGRILRQGWDSVYGNYVVVWDSKQRCAVWYAHLSKFASKAGALLKRGATVGYTGRSGNVTGAHLHVGFVETDANANRLNRNNGYQGFIDILKKGLVRWSLTR